MRPTYLPTHPSPYMCILPHPKPMSTKQQAKLSKLSGTRGFSNLPLSRVGRFNTHYSPYLLCQTQKQVYPEPAWYPELANTDQSRKQACTMDARRLAPSTLDDASKQACSEHFGCQQSLQQARAWLIQCR
jgi:hypothetical protein